MTGYAPHLVSAGTWLAIMVGAAGAWIVTGLAERALDASWYHSGYAEFDRRAVPDLLRL
jgi:hypothetical protein